MVKFSPTIYVLYLLNPWEISSTLNDGIWASLQRFSGGQLSLTESVRSENSAVVGIAIIIETPFLVCEVFPVYEFFSLFWITEIAENMQYWLRSFQFCNWITVTLITSSHVQCQNIQISQKICLLSWAPQNEASSIFSLKGSSIVSLAEITAFCDFCYLHVLYFCCICLGRFR